MAFELDINQELQFDEEAGIWYLLTFTAPRETLAYNSRVKKWTTFYSYSPEEMNSINSEFVIFMGGSPFVNDRDTTNFNFLPARNTVGNIVQNVYPTSVTVVSNENPSENKIYQAIEMESTDVWSVPEVETINGQISSLPEDAFTGNNEFGFEDGFNEAENKFSAAFLNDELSPGGLLEGNRLRDNSLVAKLVCNLNKAVRLFAVNFRYALSSRTDAGN